VGADDLSPPRELADTVRGLIREADVVAAQLGDEEAGADLEELAGLVQKVHADAHAAAMETPGHAELDAAVRHLQEASDLIDDGMPADAVIFEVLAAKARLEASLKPDS
jgi:hypothetical protein